MRHVDSNPHLQADLKLAPCWTEVQVLAWQHWPFQFLPVRPAALCFLVGRNAPQREHAVSTPQLQGSSINKTARQFSALPGICLKLLN